ncbi:MAG: response regulator [Bacteroidales bacterium]|nr:response regulator [Bacteroidales bacterium]
MNEKEEFRKRILRTFKIEAEECIQNMTSNLIELEKDPLESRKMELIEATFRESHSLKGASRAVNISGIETVCQSIENIFSVLKNETLELLPNVFDGLHLAINILSEILINPTDEINDDLSEKISEIIINLENIELSKIEDIVISKIKKTKTIIKESSKNDEIEELKVDKKESLSEIKRLSSETIRVNIRKLDDLLYQVEEMLSLKLTTIQHSEDIKSIFQKMSIWKKESSKVIPLMRDVLQEMELKQKNNNLSKDEENIKKLIRIFEWTIDFYKIIENQLLELKKKSFQESYDTGVKIENLLDDIKKIISIPFSSILDVFPKAVRDLSKDKGKKIELVVKGDDIEIDRRILEKIQNPLMHLIRNCIDHGIEKPNIRKQKNKPEIGIIKISIDRLENNNVELCISDDGKGIDLENLKKKYINQKKIEQKNTADITTNNLLSYIFKSGVSTSSIITDMSGRGLGLAIVQEKIEQLGGSISVNTEKDKGTEFKIQISLSIITFRGVQIRAGDMKFVIPTSKIERAIRVKKSEIKTVENKATIPFNGAVIPLVNLNDVLEFTKQENDSDYVLVIILGSLGNQVGFVVDEIIDEEEVLVKSFNKHLKRIRNISGATVLGSGKVIPILNVSDLLKSAVKETSFVIQQSDVEKENGKKSVLVVEDSITSRMLLKNILETAGYLVETAIDGVEGFTKLKEEDFDLVLSDVDMPRMNGFDLTSKIRSDEILLEKPIVLVTSLSKREDRERGMEVGANAYIVKSSFDQSNLLEVIDRLV